MTIAGLLRVEGILDELAATNKTEVLEEIAQRVKDLRPDLGHEELVKLLLERERLGSTGIGDGIAIPHCKLRGAKGLVLAFGRSRNGVDFNSLDGKPVHFFFLLAASEDAAGMHLKMLARISRLLKDPTVRKSLLKASDAAAIHEIIAEQDRRY